jgi:hypothetical protein
MPLWSYWPTTVRADSAIRKLIGTRGCQLAPRLLGNTRASHNGRNVRPIALGYSHQSSARVGRTCRTRSDLARTVSEVAARFETLQRALITQWQLTEIDADPTLIDDQAFAVSRFITGVMHDFVRNGETTYDVEHIDSVIRAILHGVRHSYQQKTPQ